MEDRLVMLLKTSVQNSAFYFITGIVCAVISASFANSVELDCSCLVLPIKHKNLHIMFVLKSRPVIHEGRCERFRAENDTESLRRINHASHLREAHAGGG